MIRGLSFSKDQSLSSKFSRQRLILPVTLHPYYFRAGENQFCSTSHFLIFKNVHFLKNLLKNHKIYGSNIFNMLQKIILCIEICPNHYLNDILAFKLNYSHFQFFVIFLTFFLTKNLNF